MKLQKLPRIALAKLRPPNVFLTPEALAINKARLEHLDSLRLDIEGRRVLEVGAGIGLHTPFFINKGCSVLSTDGRASNVKEMKQKYPQREIADLDLERIDDISKIGVFDVIYCYGTLYHLSTPAETLKALSAISSMILVETCCSIGEGEEDNIVDEVAKVANQAKSGKGCRPTRRWVLARLNEYWGHGYISATQPDHPEFPQDWTPEAQAANPELLTRAIFVGSKNPIDNPLLLDHI